MKSRSSLRRKVIRKNSKDFSVQWVRIRQMYCPICNTYHRELPDYILPYKLYEKEIILGALEGHITCETRGYEEHPCEMTMKIWRCSDFRFSLIPKTLSSQ